jgi:indolepyruvate ferredoxin oxidoreductase alpha subunit
MCARSFPDAPVLKLGFSMPGADRQDPRLRRHVETLVVVEEVEPLVELELKAAGIPCLGKESCRARANWLPTC